MPQKFEYYYHSDGQMWSNKGKNIRKRSANIKSYLGGFRDLNVDADDEVNVNNDNDVTQSTTTKEIKIVSCSPTTTPKTQSQVSGTVLVEIPEEFDIARFPSRIEDNAVGGTTPSKTGRKDDSAAVAEIGNNLMDLDNYMMSVYHMNDDGSATETTFSSSVSSCSTVSTRRRHRGAFRNRRKDVSRNGDNGLQQQRNNTTGINEKACGWLESMKKSSMNIFVDGQDNWTPSTGWSSAHKNTAWDSKPDTHWNEKDPIFDSIKKERLEI